MKYTFLNLVITKYLIIGRISNTEQGLKILDVNLVIYYLFKA